MTRTTPDSIWWRPAERDARRLWAGALRRAGHDRARPVAAFAAAATRLHLDEDDVATIAGLPTPWLVQPTRIPRRRGATALIPDERRADLQRFLDDLAALTRRYGLELKADPKDGLSVCDQEHDAVLARRGGFDKDGAGYRFDAPDVTPRTYLPGDEGT